MTKKELDNCKANLLKELNYLESKVNETKTSAPKLLALKKQVNEAIDQFVNNYNDKVDSQKIK